MVGLRQVPGVLPPVYHNKEDGEKHGAIPKKTNPSGERRVFIAKVSLQLMSPKMEIIP